MTKIKHLLFAATLGSSAIASANAFNVNEHDAAATGRAGAVAASDTDPSAVAFNPGGIAVEDGTNVSVDATIYMAKGGYEPAGGGDLVETDAAPTIAPSIFLTSRIAEKVSLGVGLYFPFGAALSWPSGHPQSDTIQDQTLRTYFITPSVGVNLNKEVPGLSIGAGLDIVPATVDLERTLTFADAQGTAHLGGDGLGIGGRVGVMYKPPSAKGFSFGVMYRSPVKIDFSGKGDFDVDPTYRSQLPPDGDIATTIHLPQAVWGGVAYDATPDLQVELDAVYQDWSTFKELRIELPDGSESVAPQNYRDTVTLRVGGEYALRKQAAALRAGFIWDPTPIPDTTQTAQLPDANRMDLTIGGTKYFGNYAANLGLLWVIPAERDTSNEMYMPVYKGTYHVTAFVAALSFSGSFGK
jgi:long-chain fatty acid transport protein